MCSYLSRATSFWTGAELLLEETAELALEAGAELTLDSAVELLDGVTLLVLPLQATRPPANAMLANNTILLFIVFLL